MLELHVIPERPVTTASAYRALKLYCSHQSIARYSLPVLSPS